MLTDRLPRVVLEGGHPSSVGEIIQQTYSSMLSELLVGIHEIVHRDFCPHRMVRLTAPVSGVPISELFTHSRDWLTIIFSLSFGSQIVGATRKSQNLNTFSCG